MAFLLAKYWAQPRCQNAGPGLTCPPGLVLDLANNGLQVAEVVTDGDCGVHAFGVGLASEGTRNQRLKNTAAFKEFSKQKHKGLGQMLGYLRKRCVDFLEKFKDQPIWEGMDFKTLALAMSSKSEDFGAYLRRMRVPGEWLDVAALQAMACSFKVDLLVWQLNQEPALLGYSGTPGMMQPLGTFCIAMVNDLHYWGTIPKEEPACTFLHTPDAGDFMRAVDASPSWQDKGGRGIGSERSDEEVNPEAEEQKDLPDADNAALVEAELGLCSILSAWDPWALPEKVVVEQLQRVAAAMSGGKRHAPHSCIVRQSVIKELHYEREHFDTIPDRFKYHAAAKWRLKTATSGKLHHSGNRHAITNEFIDNVNQLSIQNIADQLQLRCARGKQDHPCPEPFKSNPHVIRNWRVLWRSLPAYCRRENLIRMCKTMIGKAGCCEGHTDALAYPFLGHLMCKTAFTMLTGVGSWSLSKARSAALEGKASSISMSELNRSLCINDTNKQQLYLDSRMWLMHYADVAGDHSPMDLVTYLPKGRKSCYYAMYLRDRGSMGREAASLNTFLTAWRTELPWLKVASSLCKFVRCGVCDYLKDLIDRCPRHSKEYMAALINRLGEHFAMQSAQRLAQDRLGENALSLGVALGL